MNDVPGFQKAFDMFATRWKINDSLKCWCYFHFFLFFFFFLCSVDLIELTLSTQSLTYIHILWVISVFQILYFLFFISGKICEKHIWNKRNVSKCIVMNSIVFSFTYMLCMFVTHLRVAEQVISYVFLNRSQFVFFYYISPFFFFFYLLFGLFEWPPPTDQSSKFTDHY